MATGDITAITINADGYSADLTIEGWSAKNVNTYDEGTLPSSATGSLTVTSEGYNTSGTLGTTTRTVYFTRVMRLPYPNEASFDETVSASDLIVRVALSDYVYDDDKNGGAGTSGTDPVANISAGYITATDASETNAATSLTCTNSSTLDYPKVIGQWDYLTSAFYERVTSDFKVAFTARHGHGIAAVYLQALGVTSAVDTNSYETTPQLSTVAQNGLYSESYQLDVTLSSYTQGENITQKAIAYPVVGDADSIIDTSTNTTANQRCLGKNECTATCDKTGALVVYAVVTTTGNDATAVSSSTLATAEASPYATIGGAIEDSTATVIYCRTGTHDILGYIPTATTPRDYWVLVQPHPSDTASGITLNRSNFDEYGQSKLKYKGFSGGITYSTGNGWLDGLNTDRMVAFEDCDFNTTGTPTVGLAHKSYGAWFINCTGLGTDDYNDFSTNFQAYIFAGCTWSSAGGPNPWYTYVCNDNSDHGGANGVFEKAATNPAPTQDNVLCEKNHHRYMPSSTRLNQFAGGTQNREGISFLGNVIEADDATGTKALVWMSADDSTSNLQNVIMAHNTVVGERCNLFYNDIGSTAPTMNRIWFRNNAIRSYNIKSDTFASRPDGGRVGNWAMMNNVGYSDNRIDGTVSSAFTGDYDGPNVTYINAKDSTYGQLDFTDDKSSDGDGLGGGDYEPSAGGNLTGHSLMVEYMSFDLFGNPVSGAEIGAVQIPAAATPSTGNDDEDGLSLNLSHGLKKSLNDGLAA